jgi:2-C-methyl-D-erythritol 4-phosphate cytidylyltransferase
MKRYAIIVAGGSGIRMGTEIPKQFLLLHGKPVLMHTIERFYSFDNSVKIITVLPENQVENWKNLQSEYSFSIPQILVNGGSSRFFSVKYGLAETDDNSIVAIHDGVRPLVSTDTIKRCFNEAEKSGNAVPVIRPSYSVRMVTGMINRPVDRHDLRIIQTPQVFYTNLIKQAYLQPYTEDITDDAMLLEKTGVSICLVEGNRENIKITNPEDLIIAEALLHTIF